MEIKDLLDTAKKQSGIESDTALARRLQVSQTAVWRWRNGDDLPRPEHAHALAELAGMDPAKIVLELLTETARTEGLRRTFGRLKSALAAAIAGVVCILCSIRMRRTEALKTI